MADTAHLIGYIAQTASVPTQSAPSSPVAGKPKHKNVALGKKVTSATSLSPKHGRPATHLTDGNHKTDAYPGGFSLDYTIDLTRHAEVGEEAKAKSFDVESIVIHWGKYGRHFPGAKRDDGTWVPGAYKADYVNRYELHCQMAETEKWQLVHTCSAMPTNEDARDVSVTRHPETASASEGAVTTTLRNLDLEGVIAIRIKARGGHWIGIHELEAMGVPSP